jgi:hypothetical protein
MLLLVLTCFLGGLGAFVGSAVGHAAGETALYVGAVIGGIAGVFAATKIALARKILSQKRFWPATIGGVLGFLLAAIIATNNMSSPFVPLLSILLIGFGAVFGAASRHGKSIDQ